MPRVLTLRANPEHRTVSQLVRLAVAGRAPKRVAYACIHSVSFIAASKYLANLDYRSSLWRVAYQSPRAGGSLPSVDVHHRRSAWDERQGDGKWMRFMTGHRAPGNDADR